MQCKHRGELECGAVIPPADSNFARLGNCLHRKSFNISLLMQFCVQNLNNIIDIRMISTKLNTNQSGAVKNN